MTDYTFLVEWLLEERTSIAEINGRLAKQISKPTGHAYPGESAKKRLCEG